LLLLLRKLMLMLLFKNKIIDHVQIELCIKIMRNHHTDLILKRISKRKKFILEKITIKNID